jgi:hypothetical protein
MYIIRLPRQLAVLDNHLTDVRLIHPRLTLYVALARLTRSAGAA